MCASVYIAKYCLIHADKIAVRFWIPKVDPDNEFVMNIPTIFPLL